MPIRMEVTTTPNIFLHEKKMAVMILRHIYRTSVNILKSIG